MKVYPNMKVNKDKLQLHGYLKGKLITKCNISFNISAIKIKNERSFYKMEVNKKMEPNVEMVGRILKTEPSFDSEEEDRKTKSKVVKNKMSRFARTSIESKISRKNSTSKDERKLLHESIFTDSKEEYDEEVKNIQIPYEYLNEIFENLHQEELHNKSNPNYMEKQKDINERMRAIIINWIIEVHFRFKLFPETLFLCVNLIDRYLSSRQVNRKSLQIIAVTCLLISCKFEEIFSPEIRDFVCILDKSCENNDIIEMEKEIIKVLDFNLTVPTTIKFLEILSIKLKFTKQEFYFARYLLELSLIDYKFLKYNASLIATSASYLSSTILRKENERSKNAKFIFKMISYKEDEIIPCVMDLCFIYENISNSDYPSIRNKYISKNLHNVASITIL